ncbi:MAG: hypothetical protein KC731_40470 [Myxococcales bacterium]|nr:hypothetical protein [Myxococcales bacterium]
MPPPRSFAFLGLGALLSLGACLLDRSPLGGDPGEGGSVASGGSTPGTTGSGGTATGTATGTTTGTATGTAAGTGSGMPLEDCLNGADDDGNQLVDCEDPACMDHICVPMGDTAVWDLPTTGTCPPGSTGDVYHSCAGCQCDAVDGTCDFTLTAFGDANCQGGFASFQSTGCINVAGTANRYFTSTATPTLDSSCTPQMTDVPATNRRHCGMLQAGTGCVGGGQCLPPPPQGGSMCIVIADVDTCPQQLKDGGVFYDEMATTCSCDCNRTGASCGDQPVEIFTSSPNCSSGGSSTINVSSACTPGGTTDSYDVMGVTETPTCEPVVAGMSSGRRLCCL